MSSIDWDILIKDRKGVKTIDDKSFGNILGERENEIIVKEGAVKQHFYKIPKAKISAYDGAQLLLDCTYGEIGAYEVKEDSDDFRDIADSIKESVESIKEKTFGKV